DPGLAYTGSMSRLREIAGSLEERLLHLKLLALTVLLLLLTTPLYVAVLLPSHGSFFLATAGAYLGEIALVVLVGRIAVALRRRRFSSPSAESSVGEVRLAVALLIGFEPLVIHLGVSWARAG